MDESTVCRTLSRHGFILRGNAFIVKEWHVEEDGVGYGTEVSQNYRPDWLVFVDEFTANWLTEKMGPSLASDLSTRCFHLWNAVRLFLSSHLPCADEAPQSVFQAVLSPDDTLRLAAEDHLNTSREFRGLRDTTNPFPRIKLGYRRR